MVRFLEKRLDLQLQLLKLRSHFFGSLREIGRVKLGAKEWEKLAC
jgi:hypothetical protein